MSGFSTRELKVSSSDGRNFTLLEGFSYTTSDGFEIKVPMGSQSDGASTPREVWMAIPPFGQYWMAAYLHDYLYRYSQFPKEFCDNVFLDAMTALGVPKIVAQMMYQAVAIAGQISFDQDRRPSKPGGST